MLTDPACACTLEALQSVRSDNLDDIERDDPRAALQALGWATRDLDRKLSADSEETTTW